MNASKYVALSFMTKYEDKILAALTDKMMLIIWEWDKNRATQHAEYNESNKRIFGAINLMFFYPVIGGDDCLVLIGESPQKNHVMK